jgi:hypothetical protein
MAAPYSTEPGHPSSSSSSSEFESNFGTGSDCDEVVDSAPESGSLLSLPDDALLYIMQMLYTSSTPGRMSRLRGRSLEHAGEAYALASTCSRTHGLFTTSVAALDIEWDDAGGTSIISLFASNLRHLSVSRHMQSPLFINALATARPQLTSLHLSSCHVNHSALAVAIREGMSSSLTAFSLVFTTPCLGFDSIYTTLAALASCSNLRDLSLHGMEDLTSASLLHALDNAGDLRSLSLGFLRHNSLGSHVLEAIPSRCPRLASLSLHDVSWAEPDAVASVCTAFAKTLRVLCLQCAVTDAMLIQIATACTGLASISVSGKLSQVSSGGYVAAAEILGNSLLSLECHATSMINDDDVRSIVTCAPGLRTLFLRRASRVTDAGVFHILSVLCESIEVLDIFGCTISDRALYHIGEIAPPKLRAIYLGTARACRGVDEPPHLLAENGDDYAPLPITNSGIEELVRGCGRTLQRFHCDCISDSIRYDPFNSSFSAVGVARSLAVHCPHLMVASLYGLMPGPRKNVERARLELAVVELEENAADCVVYLDKEAPQLDKLCWTEL